MRRTLLGKFFIRCLVQGPLHPSKGCEQLATCSSAPTMHGRLGLNMANDEVANVLRRIHSDGYVPLLLAGTCEYENWQKTLQKDLRGVEG